MKLLIEAFRPRLDYLRCITMSQELICFGGRSFVVMDRKGEVRMQEDCSDKQWDEGKPAKSVDEEEACQAPHRKLEVTFVVS